jgi:uncharacterized damage-inducible protein DinB
MHPYAELLGDEKPMKVLRSTQQRIAKLARGLGKDGLQLTYGPGKWTAAQVLAHLADAEIAFGFRVRQALSENDHKIQQFDEKAWAERYDRMKGTQAAKTFAALRGWNVALFRLLKKKDLQRTAVHPERGPESVDTLIRIMAGHTLHHLAHLEIIEKAHAAKAS